jgi:hypothetical protein
MTYGEKNIAETDRPRMKIRRMCFTCWIPKVTTKHLEYATLIAFQLQQRLREEHASTWCYPYMACLVFKNSVNCKITQCLLKTNEIWFWDIGGMIMTGEIRNTRTQLVSVPLCPQHNAQILSWNSARLSAVGWGTALQAGRSRVRFPMVSLESFLDIILPAALRSTFSRLSP